MTETEVYDSTVTDSETVDPPPTDAPPPKKRPMTEEARNKLAKARERAAEVAREERLAKIKYMQDMPEDTPAGTGESIIIHSYR